VRLPVCYDKRTEELDIYKVPTLKQNLYLGIDFWRKFNLLPILASICELDLKSVEHDQRTKLAKVVNLFPSLTQKGLGKTTLITPVSQAMDKLMYAVVVRMLNLGVIEESESAWSSPCTKTRKISVVPGQ